MTISESMITQVFRHPGLYTLPAAPGTIMVRFDCLWDNPDGTQSWQIRAEASQTLNNGLTFQLKNDYPITPEAKAAFLKLIEDAVHDIADFREGGGTSKSLPPLDENPANRPSHIPTGIPFYVPARVPHQISGASRMRSAQLVRLVDI